MSYIYMNKECKFLSAHTSSGFSDRLEDSWVDKDDAQVFRTKNIHAEIKMLKNGRDVVLDISKKIISTFKVKVTRHVQILECGEEMN